MGGVAVGEETVQVVGEGVSSSSPLPVPASNSFPSSLLRPCPHHLPPFRKAGNLLCGANGGSGGGTIQAGTMGTSARWALWLLLALCRAPQESDTTGAGK